MSFGCDWGVHQDCLHASFPEYMIATFAFQSVPFEASGNVALQVQAESTVHADGLVAVSKKLEALGQDVEDTRELLAELQGQR